MQIAEPVPEAFVEDDSQHPKQFRAGSQRRLSGKFAPVHNASASSRSSVSGGVSPALRPIEDSSSHSHHHHSTRRQYYSEKLLAQVSDWLEREREKATTKPRVRPRRKSKSPPLDQGKTAVPSPARNRTNSIGSQSSDISFDGLQHILQESMAAFGLSSIPKHLPRSYRSRSRRSSRSTLHRTASSDTEYLEGDAIVPSCDAWLDNSKTLGYNLGAGTEDLAGQSSKKEKERQAWITFKNEIIRTTHTLRLKGWRLVPLDSGDTIWVERLSGALTNAVYVVTPPRDLPKTEGKKMPPKILLRIYGPQVEHLIDRENELMVLQRLARKKIGPRLLGTFQNGRFEQFFNAITLTPNHLREPETSRQIAKRMRELHEGIDLLQHERENGPAVWRNWDQWRDNAARITTFLDKKVGSHAAATSRRASVHSWLANGYVCGAPWTQFTEAVDRYKAYIHGVYKGKMSIKDRLVFAHNDVSLPGCRPAPLFTDDCHKTQYGNILRIRPDDEKSPLLQAANKHKQLVVIDFEYAAANVPGLEFANHFTEWMYNYHDPVTSHICNAPRYPTVEEQRRFVKAYVDHRPRFPTASNTPRLLAQDSGSSAVDTPTLRPRRSGSISSAGNTPSLGPTTSSSSIVDFMLDARVPQGEWTATERAREEQSDHQARELLEEARLWRPANSAMWVAWGLVQAKVPGLEENASTNGGSAPLLGDGMLEAEEEMGVDEFDYLSYAQDRALFFWGDVVQMGLVKPEELPETLRARLKIVEY